ncbi:glycosyltransferase family 2 protein [Anabaena lutea]|uniref:Glycosyltransferase n=1 Tax=Anabaena lutea FACHB-196 TaxID=2692881 RepID=A0ABR8FLM9_9NOST|nr:glycosyltransferase family 2 protein [Anabaena lutea]MBD2570587.1 glycosyltransferase [Anabaena lutea FACHB-196]
MQPNLKELPPPISNQLGLYWDEQEYSLSAKILLNISDLPRISIITPSYNQGHFIEQTIRSILLQGYPNLEYIIIDGGSTDNTVEIIKQYEPWISYWISEPDNGQAHAINKGITKATGEIIAYINSDDYYLPGTLFKVAEHFRQFPNTDLLHGICRYVNEEGEKIGEQFANIQTLAEILDVWDVWWKKRQFVQPEVFWTRRITEKVGFFKEDLNYVMDYEYWCRILQENSVVGKIDSELSCFRFTSNQKSTHKTKVAQELLKVVFPLIWSDSKKLKIKSRMTLQGKWLYHVVLDQEVQKSLNAGDKKYFRFIKMLIIVFSNPQILLVSNLQDRIKRFLFQSKVTKIKH